YFSGGASGQEEAIDDVPQDGQHRLRIGPVDDRSVLVAEHGLACDRTPRVPGELYGDQAPACAEVAHRDDLLLGHVWRVEQPARQPGGPETGRSSPCSGLSF